MTKIISDYSELLAAIAALPKPPARTVRVFRGQTTDYPKLYPSGLRRSPRAMSIWRTYAGHLYAGLAPDRDAGNLSMQDLQAHSLWFSALAQQYGPGSDFLDVSYSIDIAVWFALNKAKMVTATGLIGPDGPPNPTLDHPTSAELVGYEPWEDKEGGCIYVLDLPLWNGEGLAQAGQVVDLAKAPEIFASSPRMRAQSGCLIYCRKDDYTPFDVRELLVAGTPLRVRRPMTGTTAHHRRVADIYPSPVQDEWFARFLSVPMTYSAQPAPPTLQRSIPVVVYYDRGNQRYLVEVHFHDVAIQPPLAHRIVPEFQTRPSANEPSPTIILLEAPMVFPYPPADSDQWHHGLLWTDVPDRCPEYHFGLDGPAGEVSLANIFFEFSLLEGIGWEQAIHKRATIDLTRGVWLRRSGTTVEAMILRQETPGGAVQSIGFLSLFYDFSLRRIMIALPKGDEKAIPIDALGDLGKPVIVALMLLRYLSPTLKYQPTPTLVTDRTNILLGCARDAARLYRVHPAPPNPDWFVLRDAGNPEEPFTHVTVQAGPLSLETSVPFRDFPLAELQQGLAGFDQ
jgi:hypothetical protein